MVTAAQIKPSIQGTFVILGSCLVGYFMSFQEATPSQLARHVSYSLLLGIGVSFLLDWRMGLRNLIRVDVFALLSLYFLSYFEFLFIQTHFDFLAVPDDVVKSIHMTLFGYAAIVIGRHIKIGSGHTLDFIGKIEMTRREILIIYFAAFFISHIHVMLSVNFNIVEWVNESMGPRFARSWGRGKFGDLSSLAGELMLLSYVMPPIAGVIFARWREYGKGTLFCVLLTLLALLFSGFTGGTRNVLAIQLAGLLAGYLIVQKQIKVRTVIITGATTAVLFFFLASIMVDFRGSGLKRYIDEGRYTADYKEFEDTYMGDRNATFGEKGYFVDYNLWRISQMVGAFPDVYGFIGWNLPFVAATKPIPRAFWPDKPVDLKVGLEEAIGAQGYTIACTWIGEAYVAGGGIWIICIGLLIGIYCRFWNQLANFINSPFPLIVFASGFYAVLLLMRSLMFFTTALLPSIALVIMGIIIYKHRPVS